jgi:16S rRNA (guanine966-N2)-methyltransferase
MEEARFLDLCAGSGAVGIEALSRGASYTTFVDRSRKMCGLIEANLDLLGIPEEETEVIHAEASEFLRKSLRRRRRPGEPKSWDLIFFDPPYSTDYETVLALFGTSAQELLADNGLLIVEHHHKKVLEDQREKLIRTRILKQGDSSLSFYEKTTEK